LSADIYSQKKIIMVQNSIDNINGVKIRNSFIMVILIKIF